MPPVPALRTRALAVAAAFLLVIPAVTACAAASSPDPSAPCNGADEQSRPGFYPDLEQLLPRQVSGRDVTAVRSGRYCSEKTLGTLKTKARIGELQFAGGALPDPANQSAGIGLVVYRAPGMTLDALADAQAAGAANTRGATGTTAQKTSIAGQSGIRIDVTVSSGPELLFFWPGTAPGTFEGVTGVGVTDAQVAAAVAAFGARASSPSAALPSAGASPGASPATSPG